MNNFVVTIDKYAWICYKYSADKCPDYICNLDSALKTNLKYARLLVQETKRNLHSGEYTANFSNKDIKIKFIKD